MEDRPDVPFQPKRLDKFDLANPMTSGMRRLSTDDASRFHGERLDQARRLSTFGPRVRKRIVAYAVAGAVTIPVVHGLIRVFLHSGPGLAAPWFQVPIGAILGAIIAFLRPGRAICGFLVAGAALVIGLLSSEMSIGLLTILYLAVWFCLGMAVGIDEEMRREEGM